MPTQGSPAEVRVRDILRAALPDEYRLYPNVRRIHKKHRDVPARDGETDLVIVHPESGALIVETKGGQISRDGHGRWWSGTHRLSPPPFEQAETGKHALVRKLAELPDWPGTESDIRAGHAVAFPDVDLGTVTHPERGLGPDAPAALVLDRTVLASAVKARAWTEAAYRFWLGDGRRGRPLGPAELALIEEVLAPPPMEPYPVDWNCRNPVAIHRFAAAHVPDLGDVAVLRETGRAPELIEAALGRDTVEALRGVLHRLTVVERVPREQVVVLTGRKLAESDAWRRRRLGDQELWNGSYDEAGHHLGASATEAPAQPPDTILCETIRRFKGLEQEVVVLVEIEADDPRLDQLLYVGATRAREHLVVIGTR